MTNWRDELEKYGRIKETAQNVKTLFKGEFVKPTTDLIPVHNNPEGAPTVNARDLHAFLEVGRDFSNWIKDRIEKYEFEEGIEYVVIAETGENPLGGRPSIEYHLGLDMAKELSMVEKTDKGKQARKYFIQCERIAKGKDAPKGSLVEQARMFLKVAQEQEAIAEEQKLLKQRMDAFETQSDSTGGFYTILAWSSMTKLKIPTDMANRLGRVCSKLSKSRDIVIGKVPDSRYGKVNSYHETILKEIIGVGEMYDE